MDFILLCEFLILYALTFNRNVYSDMNDSNHISWETCNIRFLVKRVNCLSVVI